MRVLPVSQPIKVYRPLFKGSIVKDPKGEIKWHANVKVKKENKEI